jgi:hypothetical protein
VHPTQLYAAALGALLFGVAILVRRRKKFEGQVFLTFAFTYALGSFVIDAWGADAERGAFGPAYTPAVLVSLGLAVFAACFGYGPVASIRSARTRAIARVAAFAPAAVAWLLHDPFARVRVGLPGVQDSYAMQPTFAQWVATGVALWVAWHWTRQPAPVPDSAETRKKLASPSGPRSG